MPTPMACWLWAGTSPPSDFCSPTSKGFSHGTRQTRLFFGGLPIHASCFSPMNKRSPRACNESSFPEFTTTSPSQPGSTATLPSATNRPRPFTIGCSPLRPERSAWPRFPLPLREWPASRPCSRLPAGSWPRRPAMAGRNTQKILARHGQPLALERYVSMPSAAPPRSCPSAPACRTA